LECFRGPLRPLYPVDALRDVLARLPVTVCSLCGLSSAFFEFAVLGCFIRGVAIILMNASIVFLDQVCLFTYIGGTVLVADRAITTSRLVAHSVALSFLYLAALVLFL